MRNNLKYLLILLAVSYVYLMLGNGVLSLTNPDEVFYVQTAKEMAQHNTWLTPYLFDQPQFEKPIMTYWLLRFSFLIFAGVTGFGARFFPAIFGIIGVIAIYLFSLKAFRSPKKAFLSGLILSSAGFYVGMSRTVFTDMIFSVFILLSLVSFYWGYTEPKRKITGIILFFIFSALAVLTKGPLGVLLPLATVICFLLFRKEINFLFNFYTLLGGVIFLIISLPWYIFVIQNYGNDFIREFFYNDHWRRLIESEHRDNDNWYFYPFSMVACMFPWSIYVLFGFWELIKKIKLGRNPVYLFIASWIAIVFLAFQFAHSKLVSYILPLFPALAVVGSDFIDDCIAENRKIISVLAVLLLVFLLFFPVGLIVASFKYSDYVPSRIPIYLFAGFDLLLLTAALFLIIKKKLTANIYLTSLFVPILLFFAFSCSNNYMSSVSSKNACEFLLKNYKVENTILCSKMFVRGVRLNTDMPVAVLNIRGSTFFSPHPIPYLDSDEAFKDFIIKQGVTYCILSRSAFNDLDRISAGLFKVEKLRVEGNEYILRLTHEKNVSAKR